MYIVSYIYNLQNKKTPPKEMGEVFKAFELINRRTEKSPCSILFFKNLNPFKSIDQRWHLKRKSLNPLISLRIDHRSAVFLPF